MGQPTPYRWSRWGGAPLAIGLRRSHECALSVSRALYNMWLVMYRYWNDRFGHCPAQAALGQLEKKLNARGGQYFVGNNLTWADLHVYMYATDAVDKAVLAKFPKLANLVERVGNVPNIKTWVESRPKTDL